MYNMHGIVFLYSDFNLQSICSYSQQLHLRLHQCSYTFHTMPGQIRFHSLLHGMCKCYGHAKLFGFSTVLVHSLHLFLFQFVWNTCISLQGVSSYIAFEDKVSSLGKWYHTGQGLVTQKSDRFRYKMLCVNVCVSCHFV